MKGRPKDIPPAINAVIAQIDALLHNTELKKEYFTDLKEFGLVKLLSPLTFNDQTHSHAGWIALAGRQDILDWLYQTCNTNPDENYFLLHWAVVCRQSESTIQKIAAHQRVNTDDIFSDNTTTLTRYNGEMPIHLAVREENIEIVRTLLACMNNPDVTTSDKDTPLHLAIRNGNRDIISVLINAGADILAANSAGNTPLHLVMFKTNNVVDYFQLLKIKNLHGINLANRDGHTPFTVAAGKNHVDIIYLLLPRDGSNSNNDEEEKVRQEYINLGLKVAAHNGHIDVAKLILPFINNISVECSEAKGSALSIAAHYKRRDIVKMLCEALIRSYINDREKGDEFKRHTYFFVKKGAGYSRERKLAAAYALLNVLLGNANANSLTLHHGPLNNKTLKRVYHIVNKYALEHHQPSISQTEIAELKSPTGGSSSHFYPSRSRGEFAWIEDVGHAAEAAACICSCLTNNGRGYGNNSCAVQ